MKPNEDQLVKKMADLLVREKATMLDKSCPECGTLIYKLPNGKIICPSCNREIVIVRRDEKVHKKASKTVKDKSNTFTDLLNTIYDKMGYLNEKLGHESDVSQIERIASSIDVLFKIYEKVYQFQTKFVEK